MRLALDCRAAAPAWPTDRFPAVRVSGLGQQLLGRRRIERIVLDAVVVRPHRGRDRVLGRDAGRQIDGVDDRLLVDRHADGLAHAHVVERLLLGLERQIADVEARLFQTVTFGSFLIASMSAGFG
jgi:hypothetical protein